MVLIDFLNDILIQRKKFYQSCNTSEIKPNNKHQIKYFEDRKVVFDKALELYNKLLNIYKPQYDKLAEAEKKNTNANGTAKM